MLGVLVVFVITWGLLRFHGEGLAALGLDQPRRRAVEFALGFAVFALVPLVNNLLWAMVADFAWVPSDSYSPRTFSETLRLLTQAVIFEELLYRGYLLWLAIRYLGKNVGVFVSAVTFGVYHWFSYGVIGEWQAMVWVFILTSTAGFLFAYAYARTGSIFAPLGLHMGNNVVSVLIFSGGPWGVQWLVPSQPPTDAGFAAKVMIDMIWPVAFTWLVVWSLAHYYRSGDEETSKNSRA